MALYSNYLYQYPQSKNYFFRIRFPARIKSKYKITSSYFIATLDTANKNEAQWLAVFIKNKINNIWDDMNTNSIYEEDIGMSVGEGLQKGYEPTKWDFRAYLKKRFQRYLSVGKQIIRSGSSSSFFNINEFSKITDEQLKSYEDYLLDMLNTDTPSNFVDHLSHGHYMMSYLPDYLAYLNSEYYQKTRNSHGDGSDLPLNMYTPAESEFKDNFYGQEYMAEFNVPQHNEGVDEEVVNRFIVKHGLVEFQFKKQLINQLKDYSYAYDGFSDEEHKVEGLKLVEIKPFQDLFESLKTTLESIKDFQNKEIQEQQELESIPLKLTFEKFVSEKSKSVKEDTITQYKISFNFLYDLLGENFDLRALNKSKAVEIKNSIIEKSANSEKGRDKEKLSVKTVNRYLTNIGAFTSWCDDQDLDVTPDLFSKLKLKETSESKDRRRPYTQAEIDAVVAYIPTNGNEAKSIRDDVYWFPKIALYTGMRLNEIATLTTNDFNIEEGIHCISLFDKVLKTESSERKFPIHSKLIEFGLLDFVEKKRKAKRTVIFEQIRVGKTKPGKYGWGEKASRWYNRALLKNIGIDKDTESKNGYMVDFHALRTTFISCCKQKGLSGYIVKQIVGHMDDDDITFGVYGSEVSTKLEAMKQVIEKIDY